MKRIALGLILGLVLGGVAVRFARVGHQDEHAESAGHGPPGGKEAPGEAEEGQHAFVHRGTNGETYLRVSLETQALLGLTSAPVVAVRWTPEAEAFGQVLDPAPLLALLSEAAVAQVALEASSREVERLRILSRSQNASARALEQAEAALKRDQLAVASCTTRLMTGWGPAVAERASRPAFADALARQQSALVRVDLPLAEVIRGEPVGARLAPLTRPELPGVADVLGAAVVTDPRIQGRGYLLLQQTHPLPPGTAVKAWLALPGEPEAGVEIPRDALLRHEGETVVYRQTATDTFQRIAVERGRPTSNGWHVTTGLAANDRVVTVGAQLLLSEELKGRGGEE